MAEGLDKYRPSALAREERAETGKPYLDLLKHGDVAVLTIKGKSVVFICGVPRAAFDSQSGVLMMSRQINRLDSAEWHLEMIYAAIKVKWRRRLLCNQPSLDKLIPEIRGFA
jgi:hypothetical protein